MDRVKKIRQAVADIDYDHDYNSASEGFWVAISRVLDIIDKYDTMGEWKTTDYIIFECSKCGAEYRSDYNYCPNCGARMESEDKG